MKKKDLIRHLQQEAKLKRNIFSSFKNIYVVEEQSEEAVANSNDDEDFNISKSAELCNSWFSLKQSTTYDYMTELLVKCGACLTSRVALADLIIAVDKTNDYDTDTSSGQIRLETDRVRFVASMQELRTKLRRKQDGIMVVSSDWIVCALLGEADFASSHLEEFKIDCLNISL